MVVSEKHGFETCIRERWMSCHVMSQHDACSGETWILKLCRGLNLTVIKKKPRVDSGLSEVASAKLKMSNSQFLSASCTIAHVVRPQAISGMLSAQCQQNCSPPLVRQAFSDTGHTLQIFFSISHQMALWCDAVQPISEHKADEYTGLSLPVPKRHAWLSSI